MGVAGEIAQDFCRYPEWAFERAPGCLDQTLVVHVISAARDKGW
jgi:hypothetical protein